MSIIKTELLSPAGDFDCLKAAVKNGADAVYIGEKSFSARKNAKNFSWEEIKEASAYCRERGSKLYLALNTLMKTEEAGMVAEAVKNGAESGIDGLIIQDLGMAEIAKTVCPSMPIHASTQLTAHSSADVKALMELGFSRVVLSREMSREEILKIYEETGCELEAFVHGALCICFSGQCLMSSFIGGRSGNRGCCAQPCRRNYTAEGRNGFFLSPRDLSLCKKVEEMKNSGIMSFKIEGRMKSPEYVAVVTHVYRKALDGLPLNEEDLLRLRQIFSRGGEFTEGYFSGVNTPEMMNYYISNDGISNSAPKEVISFANELCRNEKSRVGLKLDFYAHEGRPIMLTAKDNDGNRASVKGSMPQSAQKSPLTKEKAAESIGKTGGTPYFAEEFTADIEEGLFVPASEMNGLRRSCFEELSEKRRRLPKMEIFPFELPVLSKKDPKKQRIIAFVKTKAQLPAAEKADMIVLPLAMADDVEVKENYGFYLPRIILDGETVKKRLAKLPKGTAVYASSMGGLSLVKEAGLIPKGDFGLNIYNTLSGNIIGEKTAAITISPELNLGEITEIANALPSEIIVYGRQEVMVSRACLIRGIRGRCDCEAPVFLKDKTGAEFPILGDRETHLNTVLNSRVTFMGDKLKQLRRCGAEGLQLRFTLEGAEEVSRIIEIYRSGGNCEGEFTRGYFFK